MNNTKLLQLANHLKNGPELLKWNFRSFYTNSRNFGGKIVPECGCAVGQWGFFTQNETLLDYLHNSDYKNIIKLIKEEFDITEEQFEFLFVPLGENKGSWLTPTATRAEVAAAIEYLIENDGEVLKRSEEELAAFEEERYDEISNFLQLKENSK